MVAKVGGRKWSGFTRNQLTTLGPKQRVCSIFISSNMDLSKHMGLYKLIAVKVDVALENKGFYSELFGFSYYALVIRAFPVLGIPHHLPSFLLMPVNLCQLLSHSQISIRLPHSYILCVKTSDLEARKIEQWVRRLPCMWLT